MMPEWKPIESAPLDREIVVGCFVGGRFYCGVSGWDGYGFRRDGHSISADIWTEIPAAPPEPYTEADAVYQI